MENKDNKFRNFSGLDCVELNKDIDNDEKLTPEDIQEFEKAFNTFLKARVYATDSEISSVIKSSNKKGSNDIKKILLLSVKA